MERNDFKEKAKKGIDEIFSKIEMLESKIEKTNEKIRPEYEKSLAEIKLRKAELELKYDSLINASDAKWEEAKDAFTSSLESFKEGFTKLASVFR